MNSKKRIIIRAENNLLRRYIFPNPPNFTLIKDDGSICSTCFHLRKSEEGLSVDIEELSTLEKSIVDSSKYRLLRLNAGKVQDLKLTVSHAPIEDNYAHALIKGVDKKKSKKLARIASKVDFPK